MGALTNKELRSLNYGCGGIASIIAGCLPDGPSAMVHLRPGARAFLTFDAALEALDGVQQGGKKATLVAVQTTLPISPTGPNPDEFPIKQFPPESMEIDPMQLPFDDQRTQKNFATLMLAENGQPTWVSGNNGAVAGDMGAFYDPHLPEFPYNVYVVVPSTRMSSPVISPDWPNRPPDYPISRKRVVPPPMVPVPPPLRIDWPLMWRFKL